MHTQLVLLFWGQILETAKINYNYFVIPWIKFTRCQLKIIMIGIPKFFVRLPICLTSRASLSSNRLIFKDIAQSSFYKPILKVQDFLNEQKIRYEVGSASFRLRQCIFCQNTNLGDINNLHTLNIDKSDGKFLCSKCQRKGSWDEFKAKFLNLDDNLKTKSFSGAPERNNLGGIIEQEYQHLRKNLKSLKFKDTVEYVKSRGFTLETIQKYQVGAGSETFVNEIGKEVLVDVIYFPMYEPTGLKAQDKNNVTELNVKLVKIKVRGGSSENKKFTRQFPSGSQTGFFGLNTIKRSDKFIVITEGEFDAMAVHQQTGYPAISLPQGATSLPDRLLPILDQFERIVIWMDNDEAGKLGADKISHKLGSKRTCIVKHNIEKLKDANDFLKVCPQKMKQLIDLSKTKAGENIHMYSDYTNSIQNRIFNHNQFVGIPIDIIPFFNQKVKGIRMQQITIVSGPTGCGKTTFLSQMSLELAKKGIPVLWGSFEIRNQVLITNMLIQYAGINLFRKKDSFDHYAQQFKELPIHWLNFHGSNDVDKVLATIEYSIQKHNISFVVLDTLQFFLADQAQGIKKFDLQDKVMSRLRRLASSYNVHIVVVIHPRKTQQNEDIQIHSVYGTSKATQQADNIWMIQSRQNFRLFDVKKNRFDGDVGKVAIGYDKQVRKFIQLTRDQLLLLFNNEGTINDIVEHRKLSDEAKVQSLQQEESDFTLEPHGKEQNESLDDLINRKKRKFSGKNYKSGSN